MNAHVIKIDAQSVSPENILEIVRVLHKDGIIIYPTDTFYGLGGKCFSQKVLRRIFEIKKRPSFKALPVLVADLEMAKGTAAELPPVFFSLAARFWPGPLTIVLKAASHLPVELVGPGRTVGIRLPGVSWLRSLVKKTGVPLITTSANISGEGEIALASDVIRLFRKKVELIVDGGPAPGSRPSTVVDLTGERPLLVREGTLSKKELERYL